MPTNYLLLHPAEPDSAVAKLDALIPALQDIGLLGEAFQLAGRRHWLTGPGFSQLVTLLGCSPNIQMHPPARLPVGEWAQRADEFCHIGCSDTYPVAQLVAGKNTLKPRCPDCRTTIPPLSHADPQLLCPQCRRHWPATQLNWRRSACVCRQFIRISGIYPAEAVPSDALLDRLARQSGFGWKYAYLQT